MEEISEGGGGVATDPVGGGSFSQLLFSEEEEEEANVNARDDVFNFSTCSSFYSKPPKMLCFGGDYDNNCRISDSDFALFGNQINSTNSVGGGGGVITCSTITTTTTTTTDSSSTSSATTTTNSLPKSNRKRNGCNANQTVGQSLSSRSQRNCKKGRSSETGAGGHAKVKKERLGERIAALQQLVSPFGKTDTASVLHEAMGYIKFLQAQVQVLCSPYLQRLPSNSSKALPQLHGCEENGKVELKGKDLRSRGLCLVPVECTLQVAESNGADFWSPATVNNASSNQ